MIDSLRKVVSLLTSQQNVLTWFLSPDSLLTNFGLLMLISILMPCLMMYLSVLHIQSTCSLNIKKVSF